MNRSLSSKNFRRDNSTPPPTPQKKRNKEKEKCKYRAEYTVEIDLEKSPQVVWEVRDDQEGCIALDRWRMVNFFHGPN